VKIYYTHIIIVLIFHILFFCICVPYVNVCNHDYSFGTIGNFINSALKNHNVTLYGSREYKRTFTHIKEICSLMIKGGFHEQFNGNIYNIEGETFPLKEVAALIANKIGVAVSFIS